jgi:putative PIN family toxin of toxin-antitoxin system
MGSGTTGVKAVFDTNVFISALGWNAKPEHSLEAVFNDQITGYISPEIMREIALVMDYPHLDFSDSEKQDFISIVAREFNIIQVEETVNICSDPDDNKFLECALASEADYIISGDSDLLELKQFNDIPILKPADFLKKLNQN